MSVATTLVAAPAADASGTRTSDDRLVGTQQTLFRSGTGGYGCFRIPSLIRTRAGTLLAFAEGRHSPSCADSGPIDIDVRRSTNDGRTWGPTRTVLSGSETDPEAPYTRDNATPVADETTGDVFLFRLIRRALTTDELTTLRETNTDPTDRATVVHLSFERVTTQGYARM
ncbi:sialidase family protein [Streptomyces sp. NBC_01235]|uniref:sialidase family protein n=1 Tax=Streptomyces sp. NBC_01235 TaxID=2903788 RepID=UPI002E1058AA